MQKFLLSLSVIMLSACASQLPQAPAKHDFEKTLAIALQKLPCQSAAIKSPFDPQEADFMCTGGRFEQLYLRINRHQENVSHVTLHWKEYEEDAFFYEKDTHVMPFLDFIGEHFLAGNTAFVYNIFLNEEDYEKERDEYRVTVKHGEGEGQKGIQYKTRKLEILYR